MILLKTTQGDLALASAPQEITYDTLRILIEHSTGKQGDYFQATLQQPGAVDLGGPFRQREPFQVAELQALRASYDQQVRAMHELAAAGVPTSPPDLRRLVDLGRRVAAVLPQTTRHGIVAALQRAQRQRRRLRITLEVTADDATKQLLGIPWELMVLPLTRGAQVDTGGEGFLLLNADVALVRQVQGVGRNTAPVLTRPLKLQALAAAPADGAPIDITATRFALDDVLPVGVAESSWYAGPGTLLALQARLREHHPQVLHLLCHGEQSDTGRGFRSDLLFTHNDGYVQRVNVFDLAPVLTLAPDLQLVVLQACYAGATPPSAAIHGTAKTPNDSERLAVESIALALVRQGVPAVVAMQGAVGQEAAGAFVQACYQTLGSGGSVEQAIATGRIAMRSVGSLVDWSLPVVYQGSGLPESETWYTRLADHVEGAFRDPAASCSIRGGAVGLALVVFTAGVLRWLLLPPPSPPAIDWLSRPLVAVALIGLAGPAIVAACHRGVRARHDLPVVVRCAALRAQWIGAYLGYALGAMLGLGVVLVLWILGALDLLPPAGRLSLLGIVALGGLCLSYVATRSQVRSALAIAPFDPALFNLWSVCLMLLSAALISVAPLGVFFLAKTSFAFLLDPAPAAIALTLALISAVLRG